MLPISYVVKLALTDLIYVFQSVIGLRSWITEEIDESMKSSVNLEAQEEGAAPYIKTYLQQMGSNKDFNS